MQDHDADQELARVDSLTLSTPLVFLGNFPYIKAAEPGEEKYIAKILSIFETLSGERMQKIQW